MSADTTAAKELRGYLERIERLESVRKDAADDIADVYKELAGRGFDKDAAKVILKIRRTEGGVDAWTGKSQTIDMYLSALGMLPPAIDARAPAHARVENIDKFPPYNPETGEITDTQEQPAEPASQSGQANEVHSDALRSSDAGKLDHGLSAPAESASDEISAPISPSAVTPPAADKTGAAPLPSSAAPVEISAMAGA